MKQCDICTMPGGEHFGPCENNTEAARAAWWAQVAARRQARMAARSWMQRLRMFFGTPEWVIANELERTGK